MQRIVQLAGVGAMLSPLLALAACPSLDQIALGSPDATADGRARRTDGGVDARADAPGADAVADAPCTADVASDPQNCGRCGHDCLDAACLGGACQPAILFTGGSPVSVLVEGPSVIVSVQTGYATSAGYIFRCTTSDCEGTRTFVATRLPNPWYTIVQGGTLYWGDYGSAIDYANVESCPLGGCPAQNGVVLYAPEGGLDGSPNTTAIAADPMYLYWGESWTDTGTIYRCVRSDCAGTLERVAPIFGVPFGLAVDSAYVYWLDVGTNEVQRCAHGACAGSPEIFAHISPSANPLAVCALTLYGGDVYWTAGSTDGGGVYSCRASSCSTPTTIASGQAAPLGVAVDDSGVYWTNNAGGTVMHCPLAGCSTPTVIARAAAPFAIALDPVSVYFTSASLDTYNPLKPGQVLRVAK